MAYVFQVVVVHMVVLPPPPPPTTPPPARTLAITHDGRPGVAASRQYYPAPPTTPPPARTLAITDDGQDGVFGTPPPPPGPPPAHVLLPGPPPPPPTTPPPDRTLAITYDGQDGVSWTPSPPPGPPPVRVLLGPPSPPSTRPPPARTLVAITYDQGDGVPAIVGNQADRAKRVAKCSALLGGAGLTMDYETLFGQITQECLFGNRVWQGMQETFREILSKPAYKGSPHAWRGKLLYASWFACPEPFSRNAAMVPGGLTSRHYPCFFVYAEEVDYVYMWCLAIVLSRSRAWYVHKDRLLMIGHGPADLL